jgi:hypothetical protein
MIHGSHSEKIPLSSPAAAGPTLPASGFVQRPWQIPPETLARHLAHLPGLIWLDSAQAGPGAVSLLTAAPLEILTGTLDHDWHRVESLLQRHAQPYHPDWPLPSGGLFGWVGYDRHFTFGHYPHALLSVHDTAQVLGAGLAFQQAYGDDAALRAATVAKLARNALLAAAVPYLPDEHAVHPDDPVVRLLNRPGAQAVQPEEPVVSPL